MTRKFIAGGCSFTLGNELSDDVGGKTPSRKTWAHGLCESKSMEYICTAFGGLGNQAIARRVFSSLSKHSNIGAVAVMWTFPSRYDWAMPRHRVLEDTRWASMSPWDTTAGHQEAIMTLAGSKIQQEQLISRNNHLRETGVRDFADAIYRYAANQYHEIYLSWKSIIWLQNILEKKKIPFMFTLADNSLFYDEFTPHKDQDALMDALYSEIDLTKWFYFGERMMGFDQWALLNDYERGTTHPLDHAHADAVQLMLPTFEKIIGGKR